MTMKTPPRFQDADITHCRQEIQDWCANVTDTRQGLYLHGACGTGKTYAAYAIKHEMLRQKLNTKVWNAPKLLIDLRSDFDRAEPNAETTYDKILNYRGLFILDDLGSEKVTEWVEETLYIFINHRYEQMLPMVITSNLSLDDLSDRIGDRIPSRVVEMCTVLDLGKEDLRLKSN